MGSKDSTAAPPPCLLVAVDFSAESRRALSVAAELAGALQLPLRVLHVVHDPAHAPGLYQLEDPAAASTKSDRKTARGAGKKKGKKSRKRLDKRTRTIRAAAEDMLHAFIARVRADHPELSALTELSVRLVVGTPAHRIVEVAHEEGAKMVVMGTRGRSSLKGILLGSNAHRVVQLCDIPVTLVRAKRPSKHATRVEGGEGAEAAK